jgi:formiminoglutamate deiminase
VTGSEVTRYFAEHAWLPGGILAAAVAIDVQNGVITAVRRGGTPDGAERLRGVVLPGLANAHSHAFHRALRGRTHDGGGTFWTWRERMYEIAARLTPESYLALATATYAEMALAGVTCVGEFHYLHHQPDGTPYDDPNAMAEVLREAASRAGIRLTLLDACYLRGGIGQPLAGTQLRFGDGTADAWAERVAALRPDEQTRIGVAVHSVRAVSPDDIDIVVRAAQSLGGAPLHAHVSEHPAENDACLAAFGVTPTRLLADHAAVHDRFTAVHATHLTQDDVALLGGAHSYACFCPTTERDLADGIGPARSLRDAGARLTLGSDQHAIIDLLEEARALEMHERLASRERGRLGPAALIEALTVDGHASLGWPEAGRLAPGAPADLVAIRLDTVRTAGIDPAQVVLAATAADVDTVIVGGRPIVQDGRHKRGNIGALLTSAAAAVYGTTGGTVST